MRCVLRYCGIFVQKKLTLAELTINQLAKIAALHEGEEQLQLMELGFRVGQNLLIRHKAPFGFPIAVFVGQTLISMRKEEAELIEVTIIK